MRIKVEAGIIARLPNRRTTSAKGGEYDVGTLPDADRKQLLSQKGVSEIGAKSGASPKPVTKEG